MPITLFQKTFEIKPGVLLLLLVLVGAFIRFFQLDYSSLWLDELYSMLGSDPNTTFADVYEYSKHDQPPLFFFLLHGWLKLVGNSDFSGRALTSIFGVFGIVAIYFLGKEIKNEKLGLFAAFITTINYFHTGISKEIRFYPLVFLLVILSYLFYLRCIKKSTIIDFVCFYLSTALLLNTHYYAMVVFASQIILFIFVLIFFKRNAKLIIGGLISGGLAGLSLLHWLPIIQHDLQITQFHVEPVKPGIIFDFAWSYIKEPVSLAVYSVCIFFAGKGFYSSVKEKRFKVEHLVVLGWIFFGFIIPLLYSILKLPLLTYKYNTITVPAFFLLIAYGFVHFNYEKIRLYSIVAVIISSFIILFIARPPHKPRRAEDWREVAAYFGNKHGNKSKEDLIVFSQLAWFHYYYFRKNDLPLPLDQNTADFSGILKNADEIWLLMNNRYTGGWPVNGFLPAQKEIIDKEFMLLDSIAFKQTQALLYKRKK